MLSTKQHRSKIKRLIIFILTLAVIFTFSVAPIPSYAAGISEQESNNNSGSATPITLNTTVTGDFQPDGATTQNGKTYASDYYEIVTTTKAPLTVKFSHDVIKNDKEFCDVKIEDYYESEYAWETVYADEATTEITTGDAIPAGTYYIHATALITQAGYGKEYSFTVQNTARIQCLYIPKVEYTGKAITITDMAYVMAGWSELTPSKDYTITYSNNKNIGLASFTITGKGSYYGTFKGQFLIVPKVPTLKSVKAVGGKKLTVTWKKVSKVSKYRIEYRVKGTTKWKTKDVASSKTTYTLSKLKANKTYQVRITAYTTVGNVKYWSYKEMDMWDEDFNPLPLSKLNVPGYSAAKSAKVK